MVLHRLSGSIIGRAEDIRVVRDAFDRGRLVNLIGPGGVGKTALATEVINELEPEFDRVAIAELTKAGDGQVLACLGAALLEDKGSDAADADRVLAAMKVGPTLVVFDNCEHLIDEVADVVSSLLRSDAEVKVLATSRRPLDIADEITWTVQPLTVPRDGLSNRELISTGSVQLFLERVRQAVPTFELTDANRAMVAEICIAADGVPLALELAAALVRRQPLDEILRAMTEQPTGLVTNRRDRPEHQRSLNASVGWSRRFLTAADARLLDRLSVFVGGFTLDAARVVDPDRTADGLARLVDHSLIGFDPATGRYRMLEVVRLDAENRLDIEDRTEATRAHFEACLAISSQIEADRYEADPDDRFPRFEQELPNLGAALRRRRDLGDLDGFRALLGPIAVWWVHYVAPEDPAFWETVFSEPGVPVDWTANAISALSFHWSHRGHHDRALEYAIRAADLHRRAGSTIARSLDEVAAGNAHLALGDRAGARAAYLQGLETARTSDHPYPELVSRVVLARLDPADEEAVAHLTAARSLAPGFGAIEAAVTTELGLQALRRGRSAEARALCQEGLDMARRSGYAEVLASALCGRAEVAVADGDLDGAAEGYTEALAIGRRIAHVGVTETARAGLDALPDRAGPASQEPQPAQVALSDRELSVARLLRGDLTQQEIAEELYIAPSTVKTHIKSIYRKLNVSKRSYAVTRATELGLFD